MSGEFTAVQAFGKTWRRVWAEDECLRHDPSAERWPAAWRRLFNTEPPDERAPMTPEDHEDWGDADAVRYGERMVVRSYDGHSLWVPVETASDSSGPSGERP